MATGRAIAGFVSRGRLRGMVEIEVLDSVGSVGSVGRWKLRMQNGNNGGIYGLILGKSMI